MYRFLVLNLRKMYSSKNRASISNRIIEDWYNTRALV